MSPPRQPFARVCVIRCYLKLIRTLVYLRLQKSSADRGRARGTVPHAFSLARARLLNVVCAMLGEPPHRRVKVHIACQWFAHVPHISTCLPIEYWPAFVS
jgi:hypothetical protein